MGRLFSALKKNLFLLLVLSLLIGCGTGGLENAPSPSPSPSPTPPAGTTTITGYVVDGFIAGASVRAYQINANGTRGDAIGAATTTDANGRYTLNLNYTGPILVESTGGTHKDWATGVEKIAVTDKLSALMSNAKDAVTINITPLTHMASLRALQDMAVNKTAVATAIDAANTKIGEYFGGIDIIKDTPIDPTVANSASGISQKRIDYALILAGISQSALVNGLNPFSLAIALARDAEDGLFDGKQGTTQLTVVNANGGGTTNLSATAAKGDLGANINTFQNSATNKSGGAITTRITAGLSDPANTGVIRARPDIPSGFSVTAVSSTQINLSWSAPSGATGYNVYKGDVYLRSVTTTTASDTGLTPNTQYCYAISAYDVSGNESSRTSKFCTTTNVAPPPVPTGLTAAAASASQVGLTWTASAGASGYKIYRGGTLLKSVTQTAATDAGLAANTQYCYTVSAYDASGNESIQSSTVCATTNLPGPALPTALTVVAASSRQINLSWTASAGLPAAVGYKIFKNGAHLKSVPSTVTTIVEAGLTASTQYCYNVSAYDISGNESILTSTVCATTWNTPPPIPAGLTATIISTTQINLSWSASLGAANYRIYRNGVVHTVAATAYADTGLAANTRYCYTLTASDSTGSESDQSGQICATTPAIAPPAGFTAVAASSSQINLSWTAAAGAWGYKIYRGGTLLKSVTTVTATDAGLAASTQYCYAIYAYDGNGNQSLSSSQVCATTYNPPSAFPVSLTARAISTSSISLFWTASTGAASYKIYREGSAPPPPTSLSTSYADTGLNAATTYCYTVTAVDGTGSESAPSNRACANTGLLVPAGLTAAAKSESRIDLSWLAATGATQYRLYKNGASWRAVSALLTSDTGLLANTQYCYSVSSLNDSGNESAQSSQVCVTTNNTPPAVPTGLTAAAVTPGPGGVINLTWNASPGATIYKIYRDGSSAAMASQTITSYSDTGLAASTRYCYAVTALDATGSESAASALACANTGLTVPAGLTAMAASATQINVSWTAVAGASGYKVYKNRELQGSVVTPAIVDAGLTANTQYCYAISAFDAAGNDSAQSSQLCVTTPSLPAPASIDLLVSNPQLNSGGETPVTITALVKDSGNRALANQTVTFTADSGLLVVANPLTNASGQATATLNTGGNQKNRMITVTASTGSLSVPKKIDVVGTVVTITGQTNEVLLNGTTILTVQLKDSAGRGIPDQILDLSSTHGNTLNPTTVTTNASGQGTTVFTALDILGSTAVITATSTAMNATGAFNIKVLNDPTAKTLTFSTPPAGKEIAINTNEPVTVRYTDISGPIVGAQVDFSSSRGTLSAPSALTNGSGEASLTITSTNVGPAVVTASVDGGPAATLAVEFIAPTAARIDVQADPAIIGVNLAGSTTQRSSIVAIVRDAENNLVKNKTVNFNIATDPSGGSLLPSSGIVVTDSFGSAVVQFVAGLSPSGQSEVRISATVAGTAITASTTLTVAQKSLFITVGTGNVVIKADPNLYQVDFAALVTDAAGNPIKDANIAASLMPVVYMKGEHTWGGAVWAPAYTLTSSNHPSPPPPNTPYPWPGSPPNSCANEDLTFYNDPARKASLLNGILDPGEDNNGNNRLDPGGIASVTRTATTDANGVGRLTVTYAREFAYWVIVRLDVHVGVAGTEGSAFTTLLLPGAGDDYNDQSIRPPGRVSPFGQSVTCADSQ